MNSAAPQLDLDDDSDGHPPKLPPTWALTFTASCAIIISVVGFLGNLLTILALPYNKKLRNAATWFVVNLAVIEMLFCVTVLPMSAAHLLHLKLTQEKLFDSRGCRLFVFLRYVIILAELLSIAAIALNRCTLIAIPKKYPNIFNPRKTFCYIIGIWVASIVVMIFPLLEIYGSFSYNDKTQECDFDTDAEVERKVYLAIGYFLPCLIIIASYSYIFYKSRQSARRVRERNNPGLSSPETFRPAAGLRNREMRIARTIAVIFLAYIICCSPVSIAHYYGSQGQIPLLLLLLHPLYWLQYCLNGFIYVFMNKQYREAYINYISQWWPNFKQVTQQCYQPEEDETSVSHQGSKLQINPLRKISSSLMGNLEGSKQLPRMDTPNARKKFQCWDPKKRERKISNISTDSALGSSKCSRSSGRPSLGRLPSIR